MSGSVYSYDTKRGRRWAYVFDTLPGESGDRRQKRKGSFITKKEAHTALREAQNRLDSGVHVDHSAMTVGKYLRAWHAGLSVKPTTASNYRVCIERHLIPTSTEGGDMRPGIGGVRLQNLQAEHLDTLYRWLERSGKSNGQGLAPKSVRHVHTCIRKALSDAVRRGYVPRNVADLANPPSQKQARSPQRQDDLVSQATTGVPRGCVRRPALWGTPPLCDDWHEAGGDRRASLVHRGLGQVCPDRALYGHHGRRQGRGTRFSEDRGGRTHHGS